MKRYSIHLTIGHNVKNVPVFTTPEICEFVTEYLDIEAFTAIECAGMWRGERENSTRIEICALSESERDSILRVVPDLAMALAQDSIMCEVRPDQVQFIDSHTIAAMIA